jgi:hypothetical protein
MRPALLNDVVFDKPQRPIKTPEYVSSLRADELMAWREPLQRDVVKGEREIFLSCEPPPQQFIYFQALAPSDA